MSRISISMTIGRLAALGLLFLSSLGPWFADTHPATEETCTAPLVWVGNGHCACLITLVEYYRVVNAGSGFLWWLGIPPLLPILFTTLLYLGGNHRFLWYFHLTGWSLLAVFSLFWFIIGRSANQHLFLWGAGVSSVVAVSLLAWEKLAARHRPDKYRMRMKRAIAIQSTII